MAVLPAELRCHVLRSVLRFEGKIDPWNTLGALCTNQPLQAEANNLLYCKDEEKVDSRIRHNRHSLTPGALCLNTTIYAEASNILYGENHFDFTNCTTNHIASFFTQIGDNTSKIQHVHIDVRIAAQSQLSLWPDSLKTIAMVQDRCANLKTVMISVPNIGSFDVEAAFRLADVHFKKDIVIKNIMIKPSPNPQSSETDTLYLKAKIRVFEPFVNPETLGNCYQLGSCDTHEHTLEWIGESDMEPDSFLCICLRILDHVDGLKEPEPLMPNSRTTRISANGKLCSVEWEAFRLNVFCDPAPTTALQATFSLMLFQMHSNTKHRSRSLAYGKSVLPSQAVFSRCDVATAFDQANSSDLEGMKEKIRSVRIMNFKHERNEFEKNEDTEDGDSG